MTCRQLIELLIDFVSDELPQEHRALVEQHLRRCPPCETYLKTYEMTIKLTRQLPCQPLPPQLVERLRAALHDIKKEQNPEGSGLPANPEV
jgi:anti-sigma factor RsiW